MEDRSIGLSGTPVYELLLPQSKSFFCPLEGVRGCEMQGLLIWIASVLVCLIEGLQHLVTGSPSLRSKKLYW